MAPPWMDMDELVEEILLRLPADKPASLVRAGLVCKRWCDLVSDPGFRRRFREFHGSSPPMLGLLYSCTNGNGDEAAGYLYRTHFVPRVRTSVSIPRRPEYNHGIQVKDSRHGRVLLEAHYRRFIVWDPIADEQVELPRIPFSTGTSSLTAAVLCAAAVPHGSCDCDDHHTGGAPFVVVVVGTDTDAEYRRMIVSLAYSSEAGGWGEVKCVPHRSSKIGQSRSALVGSALYFMFNGGTSILEYDLGTRAVSVIALPRAQTTLPFTLFGPTELTTTEDGRLGFARVEKSKLCLWSREVEDDDAGWALSKVIDLEKLLPISPGRWTSRPWLVGSAAEGVGTVFLTLNDHLFMVDLRSGRTTRVVGYLRKSNTIVVPYINFFTPVLMKARSIDDTTRASASHD